MYNNLLLNDCCWRQGNTEAPLCSIALHTNGLIMTPNYQMALVKKKPCSLPRGPNAKQRQQLLLQETH